MQRATLFDFKPESSLTANTHQPTYIFAFYQLNSLAHSLIRNEFTKKAKRNNN